MAAKQVEAIVTGKLAGIGPSGQAPVLTGKGPGEAGQLSENKLYAEESKKDAQVPEFRRNVLKKYAVHYYQSAKRGTLEKGELQALRNYLGHHQNEPLLDQFAASFRTWWQARKGAHRAALALKHTERRAAEAGGAAEAQKKQVEAEVVQARVGAGVWALHAIFTRQALDAVQQQLMDGFAAYYKPVGSTNQPAAATRSGSTS
jgi:hypothetical protein